jgi:FkbM family methyltransferase
VGEAVQVGPYQTAILTLLSQKPRLRIAVIGANDGKHADPLYGILEQHLAPRVELLLFEPQTQLIPYLNANLAFVENKRIFNHAVGEPGELTLHVIGEAHWEALQPRYAKDWPLYRAPTGVTSASRDNLRKWIAELRPDLDPEPMIETVKVPCSPLVDALEAKGIAPEIDVLQIDTEGHDDTVIHNCDLARTRPAIVNCETHHLGIERLRELLGLFEGAGYIVFAMQGQIMALRRE